MAFPRGPAFRFSSEATIPVAEAGRARLARARAGLTRSAGLGLSSGVGAYYRAKPRFAPRPARHHPPERFAPTAQLPGHAWRAPGCPRGSRRRAAPRSTSSLAMARGPRPRGEPPRPRRLVALKRADDCGPPRKQSGSGRSRASVMDDGGNAWKQPADVARAQSPCCRHQRGRRRAHPNPSRSRRVRPPRARLGPLSRSGGRDRDRRCFRNRHKRAAPPRRRRLRARGQPAHRRDARETNSPSPPYPAANRRALERGSGCSSTGSWPAPADRREARGRGGLRASCGSSPNRDGSTVRARR